MRSLGQEMEVEGHTEHIVRAFAIIGNKVLKYAQLTTPVRPLTVKEEPTSPCLLDLPLRQGLTKGIHLLDIVKNFEGPLDMPLVTPLMKAHAYDQLPAPLCPKQALDVGYHMQVKISKNSDGKLDIVKSRD